jgi:hypothetical protein
MHPYRTRPRPGLLTLIGVVSLIWSLLSLVGVAIAAVLSLVLGLGSWLGGPYVGLVGTVVALIAFLWMVASSILSILLFQAGLKTLRDDSAGVRLHRLWAWISLAIAVFTVLAPGRASSYSWFGLFYAVGVLYVTGLPEVRAYFGEIPLKRSGKPEAWDDEFDVPSSFQKGA